jgi:predicted transcriptional regulator
MAKNIIKLNLSDDLTKAEVLFKKHKIRHIPVVNEYKIVGLLSYTDLLRLADAVDDEAEGVESIVFNMFTVSQVMAKHSSDSPEATIKKPLKF